MTSEDEARYAKEMGFDKLPEPRVEVPEPNKPVPKEFRPTFYKALMLVDPIETWAFERFVPDLCTIDQTIDTRIFTRGMSFLGYVRTDVPPPSNARVFRASGIAPEGHEEAMLRPNFYRWLGIIVADKYRQINAVSMGPPLIFATEAPEHYRRAWWNRIVPLLGVVLKFERKKPGSMTGELMDTAGVGVIRPPGHTRSHALEPELTLS